MPFLFSLVVLIVIMGLIYWIISVLPIPQPFKQVALVLIIVICLLYLLSMLFGMAAPFPIFRGGFR